MEWEREGNKGKEAGYGPFFKKGTLRYAKCEILFACFVVSRGLSLVSEETLGQYFSRKLPPTFFDASVMELYTYLVGRRRWKLSLAQVVSCRVCDKRNKIMQHMHGNIQACLTIWPIQLFISFTSVQTEEDSETEIHKKARCKNATLGC